MVAARRKLSANLTSFELYPHLLFLFWSTSPVSSHSAAFQVHELNLEDCPILPDYDGDTGDGLHNDDSASSSL